jgi:hypothetical protein
VIRDWREQNGADFDYDDLAPHLEAIGRLLRIAAVLANCRVDTGQVVPAATDARIARRASRDT